jgi:hypothetical protein
MTNEHNAYPARSLAPLERLLRDLTVLGRGDPSRPPADERLASALGDDLLAAVRAELDRPELGDLPLRTRRVA